ncbi:transcription initiation factor TFIID subunit 7 [Marchantia polymorpha subsp. ruderalis]|uniref:TAFII55 protein conserved region domain-containing protein n=2 Tax=Marchantia polymorpha TaxID=3197 RepID=A0AAF6B8H8_MARPO|nr:hypothetical protein MARPO_0011s0044 [Marchantia polymorpha]PTQ46348.1 hypothetical protein MARPO_0011s0044 [Marchantia polymorpha]BBN08312.1 hypothetical protein Mp_4g10580 [Marchantia polymorpha subsp. ruderalis]BBN08313.1 hypothetical protein Mp_4g10580 [Marchantia polymorpha subsp. ruderalis]|eukprot:PTQ46347.1 hypothetical protein MARPO_0011s0044 [Marchantia polymorpha]
MEEHFILRVPPSVAERLNRVLNEDPLSALDNSIDLSFLEDGRTGSFVIGKESFPASLLDLPCVVESYKTYDDNVLIKTADIGQIIMVGEPSEAPPEGPEYKHGLTPPMRDARRRRFRREPDLNPDLVQQVENDLQSIMAGGTARDVEIVEQEEDADDDAEPEEAQPAANAGAVSEPAPASVISPIPEEPIGEDEEDEDDDAMDEDEDNENY